MWYTQISPDTVRRYMAFLHRLHMSHAMNPGAREQNSIVITNHGQGHGGDVAVYPEPLGMFLEGCPVPGRVPPAISSASPRYGVTGRRAQSGSLHRPIRQAPQHAPQSNTPAAFDEQRSSLRSVAQSMARCLSADKTYKEWAWRFLGRRLLLISVAPPPPPVADETG